MNQLSDDKYGVTKIVKVLMLLALIAVLHYILAAFIFNRKSHRFSICQGNCRTIADALEKYRRDNGKYPRSLKRLEPDYLKKLPHCPSAKTDTYSESYRVNEKEDVFTFYCSGLNHDFVQADANYPRFYSKIGLVSRKKHEPEN